MKLKASELSGASLDWAVAKCEGLVAARFSGGYVTDWVKGGLILERENISIVSCNERYSSSDAWAAERGKNDPHSSTEHQSHDPMYQFWIDQLFYGPTPLIAAMRCYVASKLGVEVDVPDGLV